MFEELIEQFGRFESKAFHDVVRFIASQIKPKACAIDNTNRETVTERRPN